MLNNRESGASTPHHHLVTASAVCSCAHVHVLVLFVVCLAANRLQTPMRTTQHRRRRRRRRMVCDMLWYAMLRASFVCGSLVRLTLTLNWKTGVRLHTTSTRAQRDMAVACNDQMRRWLPGQLCFQCVQRISMCVCACCLSSPCGNAASNGNDGIPIECCRHYALLC